MPAPWTCVFGPLYRTRSTYAYAEHDRLMLMQNMMGFMFIENTMGFMFMVHFTEHDHDRNLKLRRRKWGLTPPQLLARLLF